MHDLSPGSLGWSRTITNRFSCRGRPRTLRASGRRAPDTCRPCTRREKGWVYRRPSPRGHLASVRSRSGRHVGFRQAAASREFKALSIPRTLARKRDPTPGRPPRPIRGWRMSSRASFESARVKRSSRPATARAGGLRKPDLFVTPFRCAVVAGDDPRPMQTGGSRHRRMRGGPLCRLGNLL